MPEAYWKCLFFSRKRITEARHTMTYGVFSRDAGVFGAELLLLKMKARKLWTEKLVCRNHSARCEEVRSIYCPTLSSMTARYPRRITCSHAPYHRITQIENDDINEMCVCADDQSARMHMVWCMRDSEPKKSPITLTSACRATSVLRTIQSGIISLSHSRQNVLGWHEFQHFMVRIL